MTSAREQARERVRYMVQDACTPALNRLELADEVSDVWEPLLRDLLHSIEQLSEQVNITLRYDDAVKRARKALGE